MYKQEIEKANTLLEALPYIKKFHGKLLVVKFGGSVMFDESLKRQFARDIVLLKYIGINPVIIHGGGKEISKWMKKFGKESTFVDGLRVTDSETMEITEMVLSGKINNEIVSLINGHGGKAVGLSGKDANTFSARKIRHPGEIDLGQVGEIDQVEASLVLTLCKEDYIPVVASVGIDDNGLSLNLNADTVASALAAGIRAEKLIFLTDVDGILKGGSLLRKLTLKNARELLQDPEVTGGMIPKVQYSLRALEGGVRSVHIINGSIEHAVLLEVFTDTGIGTMIESPS